MSQAITFQKNCLLIAEDGEELDQDTQYLFRAKGEIDNRDMLFHYFMGCDFINVIDLPDFDIHDGAAVEAAMEEYEDHPELYNIASFQIARILH